MLLSKSCEYAVRAAIYIASKNKKGEKAGIIDISEAIGSPMHFTAKILQALSRKKVLVSIKGPNGGFYIEDDHNLYLIDIIRAVDGNELFSACAMGLKNCSDTAPCPMHEQIKPIRTQLLIEFSRKAVHEMVDEFEKSRHHLK